MIAEDHGLAELVYKLIVGDIDPMFVPGLNVLIRNETHENGICRDQGKEISDLFRRMAEAGCSEDLIGCAQLVYIHQKEIGQMIAVKMFQYALMLQPLMRTAEGNFYATDTGEQWTRYWAGSEELDPEFRSELKHDYWAVVRRMAKEIVPDEWERLEAEKKRWLAWVAAKQPANQEESGESPEGDEPQEGEIQENDSQENTAE